jgi:hypothetical protein
MMKPVFALVLMSMPVSALAYQQQPAPTEEAVEVLPPEEAADPGAQPSSGSPAQDAEADDVAAEEVEVSAEGDYRAALRSFRKCRRAAIAEGGVAAVNSNCSSHRRRMLSAKEAFDQSK